MAPKKILIDHADLTRFVGEIFAAKGMRAADAAIVADVLVWANLRGVDSHGVSRIPRYLDFVELGALDPKAQPTVRRLTAAAFTVTGARAAGPVVMTRAVAEAAAMAREAGVSLGIVSDTTHAGAIGRYAQLLGQQGCAAIIFAAGMPNMAYHGTRVASLSTSPVAIAVPRGDDEPLLLDMATAVASAGRINQLRVAGQPLPEGWALSPDGEPTTDPAKATLALPLGGPKGSGLAFMFECLTSVIAGAPILAACIGRPFGSTNAQNATMIAMNIATFRSPEAFQKDLDVLTGILTGLPRRVETEEILLPGDRGRRTAEERRRNGIPIPPRIWDQLGDVAGRLGVKPPAPKP